MVGQLADDPRRAAERGERRLPAVAAIVGIDGEAVRQLGEQTVAVVQAVGGLVGMGMTIVGRMRASFR